MSVADIGPVVAGEPDLVHAVIERDDAGNNLADVVNQPLGHPSRNARA
jgi:hypothetical protein